MQDQYFGDVNDYRKFGLLRLLTAGTDIRTGICWMKTAPGKQMNAEKVTYLSTPEKWRDYDPELFTFLHEQVQRKKDRRVEVIENSGLLRNTTYYSDLLTDDRDQREAWLEKMHESFEDRDLIFFDPDNGLETPAAPYGGKHSAKHLYYQEIGDAYRRGVSVMVFQYFDRPKRDQLTTQETKRLQEATRARIVLPYETETLTYFLIPHRRHASHLQDQGREITTTWRGQISPIKPHSDRTFRSG